MIEKSLNEKNPRYYLVGYIFGFSFMALAAILLVLSDVFNYYSDTYRPKSFMMGSIFFFLGAAMIISPGTTKGIDVHCDIRQLWGNLYSNSPLYTKIIWIGFAIIGAILSIYELLKDDLQYAVPLAKASALFICACIAIKAIVTIIIVSRRDPGQENINDSLEPIIVLIPLLVVSLTLGFFSYKALSLRERYALGLNFGGNAISKNKMNDRVQQILDEEQYWEEEGKKLQHVYCYECILDLPLDEEWNTLFREEKQNLDIDAGFFYYDGENYTTPPSKIFIKGFIKQDGQSLADFCTEQNAALQKQASFELSEDTELNEDLSYLDDVMNASSYYVLKDDILVQKVVYLEYEGHFIKAWIDFYDPEDEYNDWYLDTFEDGLWNLTYHRIAKNK
ncbi:MAG: hypothetical protein K6E51_09265 [Treponema sp.]|nr:hypothetical protein [Treponema sp.]